MTFKLDARGLLTPHSKISSTLDDLQTVFGETAGTTRRRELFEKYVNYSSALKHVVKTDFSQWIDGSFCSGKKEPNDIDLVSFIPYSADDPRNDRLKSFSYPHSEQIFGVDAYIVTAYPENHSKHILSQSDSLYWLDLFTTTKPNRAGRKYPKGFLEIIY